jgi:hypothetical protein
MAGVYAAPLFKRSSTTTTTTMDNQNMHKDKMATALKLLVQLELDRKFADIEDLLTDHLHLLEQRLRYDDRHGDLSLQGSIWARSDSGHDREYGTIIKDIIDDGSRIFPKLRTTQIEYHIRDVENMISWLKNPV